MRIFMFRFCLIFCLLIALPTMAVGETVAFGDDFPEIPLPVPANPLDRTYLGLTDQESFVPSDIKGNLLLVELLNTHCPHCQMQSASYNELFRLIEADPETKGKIHILALAVGNTPEEVEIFRTAFRVPFPIIADKSFRAWRAIGGSATPFSIYVRQDRPGVAGVVAGTHLGMNTQYEFLHQELKNLATTDLASLRAAGKKAVKVRSAIDPILDKDELQYRVRMALINTGGNLANIRLLDLQSGRRVYVATMRQGDKARRLFAEVTSRHSICDICHDVHFIYVFDDNARIIGFEPLQLTKWGNVNWDREEVDKMRQRLLGSVLTMPPVFDPKVDAISTATMTSAIIFDSIGQGKELLTELEVKGLWPAQRGE